jgi:hypothetical protein
VTEVALILATIRIAAAPVLEDEIEIALRGCLLPAQARELADALYDAADAMDGGDEEHARRRRDMRR